jgi:hypothetical protein
LITINKPTTLEGRICYRLMLMARFISQNGEWGLTECRHRLLPQAFNFAKNSGRSLERHIKAAYKSDSRDIITDHLNEDRIGDISLIIDELMDAENLDEILEHIKSIKK